MKEAMDETPTRIAVVGAGAVGAYFGGRLAAAGHDVTFITRGAHLEAMQRHGLEIISADGKLRIPVVDARAQTNQVGPVDVVLFSVKAYDTEEAIELCHPVIGDDTFVLTLQNGVESVSRLSAVLGAGRVVGGATYAEVHVLQPGIVRRTGSTNRIDLAEAAGAKSRRALEIVDTLRDAGVDARLWTNMDAMLWHKFVLVAASSAVTALTRQTIGTVRSDPVMREMLVASIAETAAVGRALGVALESGLEGTVLHAFDNVMNADTRASQLTDLERGRPLELEWLSGAVHRLGQQAGVPTPVHSTAYAALRPFATGGDKVPL